MSKSYLVRGLYSILILAFLVGMLFMGAWSGAGNAGAAPATEITPDPLGRMPQSPAEAHRRLQEREVGWPEDLTGAGVSFDSVESGVSVSIPYDTVSGTTSHALGQVTVELIRGAVPVQTVDTKTNSERLFTADLSTGDVQSGDIVRVTDKAGGAAVDVNCTLTGAVNTAADVVSGTAAAGASIGVYIVAPSTYFADAPPGVAHKTATGAAWTADFKGTLNLRTGDVALIYSTDAKGNRVMDVANTGGSLAVYPQYDDVLGYYLPSVALQVSAGTATQDVGTAKDGFFEAWFTNHDIVPGEEVSCNMGGIHKITVSDVIARCDPASNRVLGTGPANKSIRITMDPYGTPAVIQANTDAQGAFDVALGSVYTATGTDVYNVAWYDADGDCVIYEFQSFSWHLAEGYTGLTPGGGGFDTYVLLQNPGEQDAEATVSFQVQDGTAEPQFVTVGAGERMTLHLDELPGLADASVSTTVTSTNGATLNAERAMYFNYEGKIGGHDSIGTMIPGTTWYLAEGYTGTTPGGGGFDTWVLVQNPGTEDAVVTMKFQLDKGTAPDHVFELPAGTRHSVHLNTLAGLSEGVSVSTKVTSDVPVVAERAMYFSYEGKIGGHDSIGVTSPRKSWYLAEGYTGTTPGGGGFDTWVLVQNPGDEAATVILKFQLDKGTAPDCGFELPAGKRQSVHLNTLPGLSEGVSVSTRVTSDVDVVAERAMYFSYEGKTGGHDSKAAEEPSLGWYLAEGYTGTTPGGGGFDTWVLVQNPGEETATVLLKFQVEDGTAPDCGFELPAGARQSVHLNTLPGLSEGVSVSTRVTSDMPVVAERAMYFDYYGILGGHDSVGIPFTP